MKILVINAGSSSLKYQFIDMDTENVLAKGNCERIGIEGGKISGKSYPDGEKAFEKAVQMANHDEAFAEVMNALTKGDCKVIDSIDEIDAVGHRIVMGGEEGYKSMLVTDEVIKFIDKYCALAPLHNPGALQGIYACKKLLGEKVPEVVAFDNAFHSTMPPKAYIFPVPYEYYEKYRVRKYGAHGTSHKFVANRCAELLGKDIKDTKIITCHLGNGSSITAVKGGKVIDTSMGLTPLDGVIMGTRSGAVDPSAVLFIMQQEGFTPKEMSVLLNKKSGYLGLTGISSDDRDIKAAAENGNEKAILARDILRYGIIKYIGAFVAAMNGVDAIVFTGGIGENVNDIRGPVCEGLTYLGFELNKELNDKVRGVEAEISKPGAKVRVFVIPTNEELSIARDTKEITESL